MNSNNTKDIRSLYTKSLVLSVIFFTIVLITLLWMALRWNEGRIRQIDVNNYSLSGKSEGFKWYVGNVSVPQKMNDNWGKGYLEISGWLIRKGEDIRTIEQYVVLKDVETGNIFRIPTEVTERTDITERRNDGHNYDMCGFYSKLGDNDYIDIYSNDYEVGVINVLNGEENLIMFGKTIKDYEDR